jgi:hypothetical protein
MGGMVLTMWLVGLGVIGGSAGGALWLERAECQLRAVPRLLGATASPPRRDCACGDLCDDDAKDQDVKDEDVAEHDVCDGCDPDEEDEKAAQ